VANVVDVETCRHPIRGLEARRCFRPARPNDGHARLPKDSAKPLQVLRHLVQIPLRIRPFGALECDVQCPRAWRRNFQTRTEAVDRSDDHRPEAIPLAVRVQLQALPSRSFLDAEKRISELASFLAKGRIVVTEFYRFKKGDLPPHLVLAAYEIQKQIVTHAGRLELYMPQSVAHVLPVIAVVHLPSVHRSVDLRPGFHVVP